MNKFKLWYRSGALVESYEFEIRATIEAMIQKLKNNGGVIREFTGDESDTKLRVWIPLTSVINLEQLKG